MAFKFSPIECHKASYCAIDRSLSLLPGHAILIMDGGVLTSYVPHWTKLFKIGQCRPWSCEGVAFTKYTPSSSLRLEWTCLFVWSRKSFSDLAHWNGRDFFLPKVLIVFVVHQITNLKTTESIHLLLRDRWVAGFLIKRKRIALFI